VDVHLAFPLAAHKNSLFKDIILGWFRPPRPKPETHYAALRGVSMRVESGEILGIVGRNGAGKSTLLRLIAGIYAPDQGQVTVHGRIGAMIEIGVGLSQDLSGLENIELVGALMGYSPEEIAKRLPSIVEFAGIGDYIREAVRTYSTGMRARLAFSIATSVSADILLIDEVLAVGDAEFRKRSFERIQDLLKQGHTVVLVSHSLGDLQKLCTRVAWIEEGRVVNIGEPAAILDAYARRVAEDGPAE
jgi:ABC-type polysaccharide/polyol phosphate transport system ATPase subunit